MSYKETNYDAEQRSYSYPSYLCSQHCSSEYPANLMYQMADGSLRPVRGISTEEDIARAAKLVQASQCRTNPDSAVLLAGAAIDTLPESQPSLSWAMGCGHARDDPMGGIPAPAAHNNWNEVDPRYRAYKTNPVRVTVADYGEFAPEQRMGMNVRELPGGSNPGTVQMGARPGPSSTHHQGRSTSPTEKMFHSMYQDVGETFFQTMIADRVPPRSVNPNDPLTRRRAEAENRARQSWRGFQWSQGS